jgi:hypothetical protein
MSKINVEISPLKEIIENLRGLDEHNAEIGVYGGTKRNEKYGNSDLVSVACVHEFGSEDRTIPPRPFLSRPCIMKKNRIATIYAKSCEKYIDKPNGWAKILNNICYTGEDIVNEAFETGGFGTWPPLKPKTIARKGTSVILVDSGHLKRNVRTKVTKKDIQIP